MVILSTLLYYYFFLNYQSGLSTCMLMKEILQVLEKEIRRSDCNKNISKKY